MTEDELRELVVDINHIQSNLYVLREKLSKDCHHPKTKVVTYEFDGDYYNRAYTEKRLECVYCHKTLATDRTQHSYYG